MIKFINNVPFVEDTSLSDILGVCQTPFYLYSQEIITKKVKMTKKILGSKIFFSVKSNSNQAILKLMQSFDLGADVVSIGELKRALTAGFNPKKIIFEGVGKSKDDLLYAIQKNIRLINTESLEEIKLLEKLANEKNKKINIGVRLNPNIDGGTLNKISTGKRTDKFGIEIEDINNIINLVKNSPNLNLIGISCHIGSQINKLSAYKNTFMEMKAAADNFVNAGIKIKHVDLGGGFYIQYKDDDPKFNIEDVRKELDICFNKSDYELSFEPGRFLMAEAGILITSIITIKNNGGITYLIVDAGMNTLIRPAMYNSYHQIKSINNSSKEQITYSVAGPICESSDIFLKNIILPKQTIGDTLIIHDTGAYGKVMSSNYNTRPLPSEVLVNKDLFGIIYAPNKIEHTIKEDIIPSWL